ncbi:MAG: TetR/AcrR family transcriptional regulator [Gaiellaceae bacterium]
MTETSVRPPKQKRSQQSLERVLDASLQLLEENGFEAFTIQDVSKRARVSVGAIYARFGNKESLLRVVHRQAMDSIRPEHGGVAAADGQPAAQARDVVLEAVRAVAGIFRGHEGLLRAFMHLGAVDEEIARRGSENSVDLARQFAVTVLQHRDELTHPDPETAVDVAYRMAYCTFARQVMYGPAFESDRTIEWDDLVAEVGSACAAYLLQEHAATPRRRTI